jgi:hypothetical protein
MAGYPRRRRATIRKIIPATKIKMDESSEGLRASLKSVWAELREKGIASTDTFPPAQGV